MSFKTGSCQSCHSTFSRYLSFMEWHDFFCQNMNGHVLTLDFLGSLKNLQLLPSWFSLAYPKTDTYCWVINQYPCALPAELKMHIHLLLCAECPPPILRTFCRHYIKKPFIYYYVQCLPPNSQNLSPALHKRPK